MDFLENFSEVKVLVVGDVMIDRFWWGSVSRISPEAPVPVVNLKNTSLAPGGAANVAANVSGLGARSFLVGVIGDDEEAKLCPQIFSQINVSTDYLIEIPERPTTVKTRIIAHSQQVARIDRESRAALSSADEEKVWDKISGLLDEIEIIIISDYGKGVITKNLLMRLITFGIKSGKFVLIDPKGKDYTKYKGATCLTPNRFEVAEVCNLQDFGQNCIEEAGKKLLSELLLEGLLITQGEEGMTLFQKESKPLHFPALAREVYDVTGAGDTVIACLAVALGSGSGFEAAANLANLAARLAVEQIGTTAISREMLSNALSQANRQK